MILCDDRFSDIEAVIVKFNDFTAVDADEVAMPWVISKIGVVEGGGLAEIDLTKESCPHKKSESAIYGGAGNFRVVAAGAGEERFCAKVFAIAKGDFGNGFALRGKAKTLSAHGFVRTSLRGHGRTGGAGHGDEGTIVSETAAVADSRGVLSALRKRFTAGETILLARNTIPRGRIISLPRWG